MIEENVKNAGCGGVAVCSLATVEVGRFSLGSSVTDDSRSLRVSSVNLSRVEFP